MLKKHVILNEHNTLATKNDTLHQKSLEALVNQFLEAVKFYILNYVLVLRSWPDGLLGRLRCPATFIDELSYSHIKRGFPKNVCDFGMLPVIKELFWLVNSISKLFSLVHSSWQGQINIIHSLNDNQTCIGYNLKDITISNRKLDITLDNVLKTNGDNF